MQVVKLVSSVPMSQDHVIPRVRCAVLAPEEQESVAHNLYALLREFDDLKVDYIFSESFTQDHLGQAIMNRLSKAAGYQIYKV